ncbi:MAG: hypothetical protein RQ745_12500 [Longimicrobiales bacterium]|nr:hypothetical protein [Longimicrobiales bacterium]
MRIVSVHGEALPGLGPISVEFPAGLVAIVGADGRLRRLAHRMLSGEAPGVIVSTLPRVPDPVLSRLPAELRGLLEHGGDLDRPESVIEAGARALALLEGLGRVESARSQLARLRGADARSGRSGVEPEPLLARIRELEGSVDALGALEVELGSLRADDAEVTGDLDAATMEWLRERQDAETHLQSYRDRARELKARLAEMEVEGGEAKCPTCRRPLSEHLSTVRELLQEEWEGVVQDGSWWRRRREQLEHKPDRLVELERRALRLHAETESVAERVEVARARVSEMEDLRSRLADLAEGAGGRAPRGNEVTGGYDEEIRERADAALGSTARAMQREARALLLDRAARILGRITAGRILSMTWTQSGRIELSGVEGVLHPVAEEDLAAAFVATRIAALRTVARRAGTATPPFVLGEPFDRLDEPIRIRTVEWLRRSLGPDFEQALLVTRGEIVESYPEAFDGILELRREALAGPSVFRSVPAGLGAIRLTTGSLSG